ncbi:YetF domain-containing protein [Streptomyces prasinus]
MNTERALRALTNMLAEGHLAGFGQLPDLVARHAGEAGMTDARIYLTDLREQILREVTGRGLDAAEGGRLNRRAMRRELMTEEEVRAQLRLHGVDDLSDISRAYLEPNGMISIIRRGGGETDEPARPEIL